MHAAQIGRVPAALVWACGNPYIRDSSESRSQEATMTRSDFRLGANQTPAAAVTLAQSEVLAPVALAIADLVLAGIGRIARLFGRG